LGLSFSVFSGWVWPEMVMAGSTVAGECHRQRGEGGEEEKKEENIPGEEVCVRGEGEEEKKKRKKPGEEEEACVR
jgi:hypothetical protein